MNLIELNDNLYPDVICEDDMKSRIAKILEVCERSKDLMIGVNLMNRDNSFYCNHKLREIVSDDYSKLLEKGWDFWYSIIDPGEVIFVRKQFTSFFLTSSEQTSLVLKYHIVNNEGARVCLKHEICIHEIEKQKVAISYLFDITDKERVEQYFGTPKRLDIATSSRELGLRISAREKEVLELIADGFSSKEIANRLFISNHTAISHRKNLIEKFKVKNTAHLVKKSTEYINL